MYMKKFILFILIFSISLILVTEVSSKVSIDITSPKDNATIKNIVTKEGQTTSKSFEYPIISWTDNAKRDEKYFVVTMVRDEDEDIYYMGLIGTKEGGKYTVNPNKPEGCLVSNLAAIGNFGGCDNYRKSLKPGKYRIEVAYQESTKEVDATEVTIILKERFSLREWFEGLASSFKKLIR